MMHRRPDPMTWTKPKRACRVPALLAGLMLVAVPALAEKPLSASDWLSGSLKQPDTISAWRPGDARPRDAMRNDTRREIAPTGAVEPVGVTRLGEGNPDRLGTVSPRVAGLPADLWGASDAATLSQMITRSNPQLPALRRLMRRVLAAQLEPPVTADGQAGQLFLARVDKLLDMGATGAAKELLKTSGPGSPARFRRLFDISLLSGEEAKACETMDRTPGIAPSFAARVYCLAHGGDWAAAALVFHGAEAMGQIDPDMARLLSHYLDDSYVDGSENLTPPAVVTPLALRLHEAIGQPISSSSLPLAFALSDLDGNGGWKAQLDAAERLARSGAIPASQLRAIYVQQSPAASGGVWDRAAAIQALADALALQDLAAVAKALPPAFDRMTEAGLGPALADMVGAEVGKLDLIGRPGQIALWLALQAGQSQVVETPAPDITPFDAWLLKFAGGDNSAPPSDSAEAERAAQFAAALAIPAGQGLASGPAQLIADNRRGEALLGAIADVDAGSSGDTARAAQGLTVLDALQQQEIARQAAVELILGPMMTGPQP